MQRKNTGSVEQRLIGLADLVIKAAERGRDPEISIPVRSLSNRSSGKMGYAVAEAAAARGARVILVSGPTALPVPPGVDVIHVETAQEMYEAVLANLAMTHVVIKAAAVADYRPKQKAERKLKKEQTVREIALEPTPDILAEVGRQKGNRILVGFAAETDDLLANATDKLVTKRLDLIVGNDISQPDAGFEVDTNRAVIVDAEGGTQQVPLQSKSELAGVILDRVAALLRQKRSE